MGAGSTPPGRVDHLTHRRVHPGTPGTEMSTWPKVCPVDLCEEACGNLRSYISHIRNSHQLLTNLSINCPVDGCISRFTTMDGFRRHAEWRHRMEYNIRSISRQKEVSASCPPILDTVRPHVVDDFDHYVDLGPSASSQYEDFIRAISIRSACLRLQIEHKFDLPTSVAKKVFEEALHFGITMCQDLTATISTRLRELKVTDDLLNVIVMSPELQTACKSISETSIAPLKHLGLVEPVEVDLLELSEQLGKPQANFLNNGKRPKMHYVPILETIKSFLSHPDVMQSVLRESASTSHFKSFRDGSIYSEHALFQEEPNALRITLYTDELELCNPIGGNNKKHKICCVYFQVNNIGTKYLSSLQTIHLCLLVKDSYRTKFGYEVVLKLLLDDLKTLAANGVFISLKGGGSYHFRGAVTTFCGDNLSAHNLGGFRRTFSSGKVCRWCMVDYKELSQISSESECTLRTEMSMQRHCHLVAQDPTLEGVYGVSGSSLLSQIPHFRVPLCLPPDAMHDILEKILCLNIKVVIRGLHKNKVVSFCTLRQLLNTYKFGILDKINKHPGLQKDLLEKKKSIRGSASQKWHLFHFFSLVIGPHVPQGNRYWQLHLLLNQICDIVFAATVSERMIKKLERVVKLHHNLWVNVVEGIYPPKLHYLVHYPRYLRLVGPLRFQWCMRFEAFHQYIKRMSQKCNNFIEITKTMSNRVQRKRCLLYSGSNALPSLVQITGSQHTVRIGTLPAFIQSVLRDNYNLVASDNVLQVSAAVVEGLKLRPKCYYVSDVIDEEPVFSLVHRIFVASGNIVVFGRLFKPIAFNAHLHAYEISEVPNSDLCYTTAQQLRPFHNLHVHRKKYLKLNFTVL